MKEEHKDISTKLIQQPPTAQKFLSFFLADETQALLPSVALRQILNLEFSQIVPILDMPSYVMGICYWQQEVLWLVDFPNLLGLPPLYTYKHALCQTVLVIHSQNKNLGLAVYNVGQTMSLYPEQIHSSPTLQEMPQLSFCLKGHYLTAKEQVLLVLEPEAIFKLL